MSVPPDRVSVLSPAVLRRFLLALLCAAGVLSLVAAAIYRQDVLHQQVMLKQESQHVLALQQELLRFELRAVQSDLLYLAHQKTLARFLSGDAAARDELQREYVSFALNKAAYDQIRCLDTTGQEIVRVNYRDQRADAVPRADLQSKATRYYYQQTSSLDRGEVFVSPFDLNEEHGAIQRPIKPVIRFLTPVFDESGRKRGLLVLNYLGARLLSKLKQASAGFRGETMLVNPAGEFLQAPDPQREWGWLLAHQGSFRGEFPDAWEQASRLVAEQSHQFHEGGNLFTAMWVSPGHRQPAKTSNESNETSTADRRDTSCLALVAYVSSETAGAHSRELLGQLMLMSAGVMVVVALLLFYWAWSGEIRRYHKQRIAESESRLRQLSSLLLAAQESERRRLSRDLHDQLGQQVTAICLDLRSLAKKDGAAESSPLLQRAIDETDQLLRSLHEIATRVRPSVLDDLGLQEAVESYLSEYQQRTGIKVGSRLHFHRQSVPATVGENVYRILQEALANVATHARAGEVEVSIHTDDSLLRMTVRDGGVGFEPDEPDHSTRLGILGMRERVELLGGRFDLQSTPGRGTQLGISIPLNEDN